MSIVRKEKAGVVILKIEGPLEHHGMADIKNEINELVSQGKNKVVLDLRKTERTTLFNIGVIVEQMYLLRSVGGDLKLVGMKAELCKAFDKAGAGKLFCRFDTEEEAIADFERGKKN